MRTATYSPTSNRYPRLFDQVLLSLGLGLLLVVVTAGIFVIGFELAYLGRIYPGVSVAGIDLSGLSTQQAAVKIVSELRYPQQGRLILQDKTNNWMVSPAEMGLVLDPDASAKAAFEVGRSGSLPQNLTAQFSASSYGHSLAPVFLLDERMAMTMLNTLADQINQPMIEATIGVNGTEVVVNSGKIGRMLDTAASLERIRTQILTLQDGAVELVVKETAPVILDTQAQADLARHILSQPLTITLPSDQPDKDSTGPWKFDVPTLASMLTFERIADGQNAGYQIALNRELLITYLTNLAPKVKRYPQNARFIFNDDTRQLDLLEHAVIGRTLDVPASLKAIQEGVLNGKHKIALVFQYNNPPVTDDATADSLGIHELIRAQTSYFRGSSAARVQNITAAAGQFHGLLVAPGETFSMANYLGDISLDNGYAEALIIVGDQTITGVGGGVCQVSTTLFRTVFFAGFPIVERHAHAYRVGYYEQTSSGHDPDLAGMDATVFVPLVDFKFVNDTPYWLLMETYINGYSLTWKFYSTSDGRKVDWTTTGTTNIVKPPEPLYKENPDLAKGEIKQVDWAVEGADVNVTRTVTKDGQTYFTDNFFTRYQPWRDIFEYGPGTEIPKATPTSHE